MKTVNYSCRLWTTTRLFLLGLVALLVAWSPLAQAAQSVTLAWNRSTDSTVTGYKIYYTDLATSASSTVNAGNVTSNTVPGLTATRTYSFYVVAYDASGVESVPSNVINYTVPGVNTAPTISSIANLSTTQSIPTAPIAFTVGDAETPAGSLSVSAASSNSTLVPVANIVFGGSGASRTVMVTPALNQTGTATITVTVSDGSLTASRSFVLTVNPAGPFTPVYLAIEAESGTLVDPINVYADAGASGGNVINVDADEAGSATYAVNIPVPGDYVVWCKVLSADGSADSIYVAMDGGAEDVYDTVVTYLADWQWTQIRGRSAGNPQIFSLGAGTHNLVLRGREANVALDQLIFTNDRSFVPGANTPPTISNMADLSTSQNTATAPIAFTVGDAQTAAGSLTVTRTSSNPTLVPVANIVLGGSGANRTVTVTPAANLSGTATITVTVSDGSLTASDSFVLTVNSPANTAPTISNIADLSTPQNTATAPIAFTVGDAQTAAGSLTVTRTSSNPTLVPTANIVLGGSGANRTVTVTPAANLSGTATITVTVSDGSLTASDSFVLTVNAPANTAPTISNIADLSTPQNTATAPIAFTVGDAQTAAGSLTVTLTSSNPTLVPTANIVLGGSGANRTVTVTPALNQSGTATITVTVSDGSLTASDSFVLSVNSPANTAPTISDFSNQTTTQSTATAPIAFTVGDSQTAAGSLTVSGASSNPTLVPAANIVFGGSGANRTVTVTPALNQTGTSTITVTVSDGSLNTSKGFVLTVNSAGPFTPVYVAIEAESATLVSPMVVGSDLNATGGQYIAPTANESGTATFAIDVPVAGDYVVWCRVRSTDNASDSIYVSMNGGAEDIYDTVTNGWSTAWQWTAISGRTPGANPRVFSLSAGRHTLVFRGREADTAIDQMLITNDRSYVPDVIFKITTPAPLASSIRLDPVGSVTVTWPAVAGKNYRVMYKNNLTDSTWTRLHPDVRPDSNQASKSDYVVGNRFYQVIELP